MPKLNAYDAAKASLALVTFDRTRWTLKSPEAVLDALRYTRGTALMGFAEDYAGDNAAIPVSVSNDLRDITQAVVSLGGGRFTHGDCWLFALLAAERLDNLGFVIRECDEFEGSVSANVCAEHVGLYLKDESVLDVDGVTSFDKFIGDHRYDVLSEDGLLQRWRKEGGFEHYMDPRDDFALNGRCRTIIEAVAWLNSLVLEKEWTLEDKRNELHGAAMLSFSRVPEMDEDKTLIVVHPGSMMGSANQAIGRDLAQSARTALESELQNWSGNIAVLDGFLSDELTGPFGMSIGNALQRCRSKGLYGIRTFGCDSEDPSIEQGVDALIQGLGLNPKSTVCLSGAWYDPENNEGCVNAVQEHLCNRGINATVLDSALHIAPDEPEDDEEPSPGPRM